LRPEGLGQFKIIPGSPAKFITWFPIDIGLKLCHYTNLLYIFYVPSKASERIASNRFSYFDLIHRKLESKFIGNSCILYPYYSEHFVLLLHVRSHRSRYSLSCCHFLMQHLSLFNFKTVPRAGHNSRQYDKCMIYFIMCRVVY
jgi:hypothetical protein